MRTLLMFAVAVGFLLAQGEAGAAQQVCDNITLTVTGRIEEVTFNAQNNEYVIVTRSRECSGAEVAIYGRGEPPRACTQGATVSATGVVQEFLGALDMERPSQVNCY